jgi:hypothetical protein
VAVGADDFVHGSEVLIVDWATLWPAGCRSCR